MTNRFLISVAAAALIAGTGLANAQGLSRDSGSTGSPAAQQSAPSPDRGGASPGGAMHRDNVGTSGMKGESGMTKGESGMKADSTNKSGPASKSAQDGNRMQGEKSKSMSSDDSTRSSKEMKAEGRDGKTGDVNTKGAASTDSKSQTTGNAATSATAAPPAEKRTQIVSAIRSEKIQETTNVNFNVSVGAETLREKINNARCGKATC